MVTRIAAGLAVIVAVTAVARAAGPPVVATANRRFDHDRHAASAGAAGKPAPCAACHDDRPRAEHARCAGCHQFPSSCSVMQTPGVAGPARVCRTCHTPTRTACLPGDLPPLPARASFTPRFTHAKHLTVGASIEKDCGVCHRAQAEPAKQKPHVLCSGCHNPNGARPTMADCASCHAAGPAPAASPADADPFRLAGFDHRAHTTASKLTACLSCHDKPAASGDALHASMLGCQTRCHDGQKSFSATGTHCTMCHKPTPQAPAAAARTDLAFSHAEHARRGAKLDDCAACHVLDTDGTLAAPLARKDHQPCASAGCHQTEFVARAPKICGSCHDTTAPWLHAAARAARPAVRQWSEAMNHASHLARSMTCETCHGDKRAGADAPHDHRACIGCHGRSPSPQPPTMADCKGCHAAGRPAGLAVSPWSVARNFEHTKHAIDPRSRKPTACAECHTQIARAVDLAAVTRPRMADCDGCHDGKIEFKTTGFGCVRCHGPRPETAALAPRRGPR